MLDSDEESDDDFDPSDVREYTSKFDNMCEVSYVRDTLNEIQQNNV